MTDSLNLIHCDKQETFFNHHLEIESQVKRRLKYINLETLWSVKPLGSHDHEITTRNVLYCNVVEFKVRYLWIVCYSLKNGLSYKIANKK